MRRTLLAIAAVAAIFMAGALPSGRAAAAQAAAETTDLARTALDERASATVADYARYRRRGRWYRYGYYRPRYRYVRRYYRPRYYRPRFYGGPRYYRRYYY